MTPVIRTLKNVRAVRKIKPIPNMVMPPSSQAKFVKGKTLAEYNPKIQCDSHSQTKSQIARRT